MKPPYRWLIAAGLVGLASCVTPRPQPVAAGPILVAVVEAQKALEILVGTGPQDWQRVGTLPLDARAIRFSLAGQVEWLRDDPDGPRPCSRAFRAQLPAGTVVELSADAVLDVGHSPLLSETAFDSLVPALSVAADCLDLEPPLCGTALRLLDLRAGTVLAATNEGLIRRSPDATTNHALHDVLEGRLGEDEAVIVYRATDRGRVEDVASVWERGAVKELLRAPVIVEASPFEMDRYLVIRQRTRENIYVEMLAHAPEEFGGDATGGEAIVIDRAGHEEPLHGLEGRTVRTILPFEHRLPWMSAPTP